MSLAQGNKTIATDINNVFTTLESIRARHYAANPIPSMGTAFNTNIASTNQKIETNVMTTMKTYIQTLENSRFLTSGTFSGQVAVPSVGSLLKASDVPITVVNNLNAVATNAGNFSFTPSFSSDNSFGFSFSSDNSFTLTFSGNQSFSGDFSSNNSFKSGFSSHNSFSHSCTPCQHFR